MSKALISKAGVLAESCSVNDWGVFSQEGDAETTLNYSPKLMKYMKDY